MKIIILLTTLLISFHSFSQSDSLLKKYDQQLLYRYGSHFMKGGNKVSFSALREEFINPSISFDLYAKAKKDKTISSVLRYVSLLAFIGVAKGASDNNRNLTYGFLAGQFVTLALSRSFQDKSTTGLDRAIQIRNRELLFPGR
ncbi:hypothetical protein CAP36_08840 [Chitinophagaceae bacterium IBVUCB2]|nr:hypothetical protein CAP36_08840 [Chitinophagaceae bacterium IBVUCB2]